MTVKRKLSVLDTLPPGLRPARWQWFHTLGLIGLLIVGGLTWLFPADAAALAGTVILDYENAMWFRGGLFGLALWVAFVVRGQPGHAFAVCLLLAAFLVGQMLRAEYGIGTAGITFSLLTADLAALWLLLWLAWRPSSYERLAESEERVRMLEAELQQVRGG